MKIRYHFCFSNDAIKNDSACLTNVFEMDGVVFTLAEFLEKYKKQRCCFFLNWKPCQGRLFSTRLKAQVNERASVAADKLR